MDGGGEGGKGEELEREEGWEIVVRMYCMRVELKRSFATWAEDFYHCGDLRT